MINFDPIEFINKNNSLIDDCEEVKVYAFKLKKEKDIYAFTTNKEYAKEFKSQRNMKLFDIYEFKLEKHEYMVFSNKNKNLLLIEDNLDDGKNDIRIISTINESDSLSESCDYIVTTSHFIENDISEFHLKSKYLKLILKITDVIKNSDEGIYYKYPTLNINTFKLFYHLFRNTFSEYSDINDQE